MTYATLPSVLADAEGVNDSGGFVGAPESGFTVEQRCTLQLGTL